jgi:DnaJ-domain-containing protein 1
LPEDAFAPYGRRVRAFILLAYEVGRTRATGRVVVEPLRGAREEIAIREGGFVAFEADPLGRRADAELSRLAAIENAVASFFASPIDGRGRTWPLDRWARRALDREIDIATAGRMGSSLGSRKVSLRPDARSASPLCSDEVERVLAARLASGAHLSELVAAVRAPRYRVLAFLHFLDAIGVLDVEPLVRVERIESPVAKPAAPTTHEAALELLGVPPGASSVAVKAAFRRLAKKLHPDLHPGVGEARRRDLERQLALVNAAYGELTG